MDIKRRYGKVTMLINNAGVVFANDVLDGDCKEIEKTMQTNLLAHFWVHLYTPCILHAHPDKNHNCRRTNFTTYLDTHTWFDWQVTRCFLPDMLAMNRGHLVHINSILGLMGLPGAADYSASKHAVTGMTEALRQELSSAPGVNLTCVYPYIINTDMFEGCKIRYLLLCYARLIECLQFAMAKRNDSICSLFLSFTV